MHDSLRLKPRGTLDIQKALLNILLNFFGMLSTCVGTVDNKGHINRASACVFLNVFGPSRSNIDLSTRFVSLNMMKKAL